MNDSNNPTLFIANGRDLLAATPRGAGDWRLETALGGVGVQTVAVDPLDATRLYVGTFDRGLYRSRDGGRGWVPSWNGPPHQRVLSVAVSPSDREGDLGVVYAGTEPSALFVSRDGGGTWEELAALRAIPSAPSWSFPPRPWTSHVRAIGLSYRDPDVILAGIELGGVMRSPDRGRTWEDHSSPGWCGTTRRSSRVRFATLCASPAGGRAAPTSTPPGTSRVA